MSNRWSDRIETHAATGLLHQLSDEIRIVPESNPNVTPDALSYLRRASRVFDYLKARLRGTQPMLISPSLLDQVVPYLQSAQSHIQAFASDNDEGHLRDADQQIDAMLAQIPPFPPLPFRGEAAAVAEAADSYSDQLCQMESTVRDKLDGILKEVSDASTRFEESVQVATDSLQRVNAAAEKSASDIAIETDAKLVEVRAEVDSQKARLDSAITQMQAEFLASQQQRLNDFASTQTKNEEAFRTRVEEVISKATVRLDSASNETARLVESLNEKDERAAQILALTAASGAVEAYRKEAEEQRKEADRWRLYSSAFAVAFVIFAAAMGIWGRPQAGFSAEDWVLYGGVKAPVALALASIATYFGAQSKHHREREREARRFTMELTTFRPFLAELSADERCKIVAEAQRRYFVGHDHPDVSNDRNTAPK